MSVYNGEKFLEEAIDSIINQTHQNWEFIIINDASTDATGNILDIYKKKDSRFKIINKEVNKGLPGFIENLNLGLYLAEGKYIARMDADDISYPERFQKQVDFLENNPEIFIVGSQINFIDENNKIIGEKLGAISHHDIVKKMTADIQLFHPAIMFKNDKNIRYREKFLFCEDYDFYLNLITKGKKLANINEKLLNYRILDKSISRKGDGFVKKLMVAKAIFFYNLRKNNGSDSYENFDNRGILNINDNTYKNNKADFFLALDTSIKHNNKPELKFLIHKFKKQLPYETVSLKYYFFYYSPTPIFKVLKKIFGYRF